VGGNGGAARRGRLRRAGGQALQDGTPALTGAGGPPHVLAGAGISPHALPGAKCSILPDPLRRAAAQAEEAEAAERGVAQRKDREIFEKHGGDTLWSAAATRPPPPPALLPRPVHGDSKLLYSCEGPPGR
jgi:hypothetical protein